jgi:hypothetical protein
MIGVVAHVHRCMVCIVHCEVCVCVCARARVCVCVWVGGWVCVRVWVRVSVRVRVRVSDLGQPGATVMRYFLAGTAASNALRSPDRSFM